MLTIGLTAGVFDVLHWGYFELFRDAKDQCDFLIVALHTDPSLERPWKAKPLHSVIERIDMLSAIRYIDGIVMYQTEAELAALVRKHGVDVRIVGSDYEGKLDQVIGPGKQIYVHKRDHGFSATNVRERLWQLQGDADRRRIEYSRTHGLVQ